LTVLFVNVAKTERPPVSTRRAAPSDVEPSPLSRGACVRDPFTVDPDTLLVDVLTEMPSRRIGSALGVSWGSSRRTTPALISRGR